MRLGRPALLAITIALATPASAQDDPQPTGVDVADFSAIVTDQSWYPEGYRDVRIAAEAQVAEMPRSKAIILHACSEGVGQCYDPYDSAARRVAPDESDISLIIYGNIALEISRLRQEFERLDYPAAVFAAPLTAYERALVDTIADADIEPSEPRMETIRQLAAAVEANRARLAPSLPGVHVRSAFAAGPRPALGGGGSATRGAIVVRSSGPSAARYASGTRLSDARLVLMQGDTVVLLTGGGTRRLVGPGTFDANIGGAAVQAARGVTGGLLTRGYSSATRGAVRGGAGRSSVVVTTSPVGGEVLLVSAFAFKLCSLKQSDGWDRFKCKWNEIETGVGKPLSGRYVYQVHWPDGVVRKGTREIAPSGPDGTTTVTFKKVGS